MWNWLKANEFLCVWTIWNGLFLAFLGIVTILGWTAQVLGGDPSYLSHLILIVFMLGWAYSLNRAVWASKLTPDIELHRDEYGMDIRMSANADALEALQARLGAKLAILDYIPRLLVNLGLVGTVVGIMLGMSEIKPEAMGDLNEASKSLSTMMHSIGIGFTTTLIGAAGAIWIQFQEYLIAQQVQKFFANVLVWSKES